MFYIVVLVALAMWLIKDFVQGDINALLVWLCVAVACVAVLFLDFVRDIAWDFIVGVPKVPSAIWHWLRNPERRVVEVFAAIVYVPLLIGIAYYAGAILHEAVR